MFPSLVSWLPGGQLIWVVLVVLYMLVLIGTTYRIIMDTENSGKALAYLLLLYMLPVV
ncbi:MAG: hypothetical protein H6766_07435 [Candidatus Peribacteria bacterium]|nr:MAG: hypothetical protein H6766_07435 [Candidatus Peribacteria bacterium]